MGTYIRCPVGVRGVACAAVGLLYPGGRTEPQEQRSFLLPGKVCLGALRQGPYNSRGGSGAPLGPLLLPMLLLLRLQVCGHVFVPKYVVWAESELTGGSEHKTFSVDLFGNGEGTCASGGGTTSSSIGVCKCVGTNRSVVTFLCPNMWCVPKVS